MSNSRHTPGKIGSGPNIASDSGPRTATRVLSKNTGVPAPFAKPAHVQRPHAAISPSLLSQKHAAVIQSTRLSLPSKQPQYAGAPQMNAVRRPSLRPAPGFRTSVPKQYVGPVPVMPPKSVAPRLLVSGSGTGVSPQWVLGACSAVIVLLTTLALFIPSQVLLVVLLCAFAATLAGIFCTGLNRMVRISTCAVGILCILLAAFGIVGTQHRKEAQAFAATECANRVAVEDDLKHNCYLEATRRIEGIAARRPDANGTLVSFEMQNELNTLHAAADTWLKRNFGEVSPNERQLLIDLWRQFGSLAAGRYKHFRAIRLDGSSLELTMIAELKFPAPQRHVVANQLLDAVEPLIRFLLKRHEITTLKVRIYSAGEESVELATVMLTEEVTAELRKGKWGALRDAVTLAN